MSEFEQEVKKAEQELNQSLVPLSAQEDPVFKEAVRKVGELFRKVVER